MPICFRLLVHWARRAASRAAWTAGRSRAIKTAMMAITTSSSMRVKARLRRRGRIMRGLRFEEKRGRGRTDVARRAEEDGWWVDGSGGGRSVVDHRFPSL